MLNICFNGGERTWLKLGLPNEESTYSYENHCAIALRHSLSWAKITLYKRPKLGYNKTQSRGAARVVQLL